MDNREKVKDRNEYSLPPPLTSLFCFGGYSTYPEFFPFVVAALTFSALGLISNGFATACLASWTFTACCGRFDVVLSDDGLPMSFSGLNWYCDSFLWAATLAGAGAGLTTALRVGGLDTGGNGAFFVTYR